MRKFLAGLFLLLLLVGCSDKDSTIVLETEASSETVKGGAFMAQQAMIEMLGGEDGIYDYPYNFGGAYYDQYTNSYIIMITNDDLVPYKTITDRYNAVEFVQAEYSMIELERIRDEFLAAHPEIECEDTNIQFDTNMVFIALHPLYYDENIQELQPLVKELPIEFKRNEWVF